MNNKTYLQNHQKLLIGFGIIISFFLGFGLFTLSTIQKLSKLTSTIYNHPLVVSNASLQANVLITKMHKTMKDVVLFDSNSDLDRFIKTINEEELNAYKHLDIVKLKILGQQGQELESIARNQFKNWKNIRNEVIELVKNGDRKKAAIITVGKGAKHVDLLEKDMQGLTNYARNKASEFMSLKDKEYSKAKTILLILLFTSIVTSFIITFFIFRQNKKAETRLKSSEKRYRSLVETQTDLVSRFNPDGKFTFVNEVFCKFFNKTRKELFEGEWTPLPVEEDIEYVQSQLASLSKENPTVIIENRVYSDKGDIYWMQFVNQAFFDSSGNLLEIQSVGRDITELKQAERILLEQEKLQGVLEMAGAICHEMSQPLQIVSGSSELLLMDIKSSEPEYKVLKNIEANIKRMGILLSKVMRISRYKSKPYLKSKIVDIEQATRPEKGTVSQN